MEKAERVLTLPNQSWAPNQKDKPRICVLERAPKGADGSCSQEPVVAGPATPMASPVGCCFPGCPPCLQDLRVALLSPRAGPLV